MKTTKLKCVKCSKIQPLHNSYFCSFCGSILKVDYDYLPDKKSFEKILLSNERSLWKYKDMLPVKNESNIISLGEGFTPLVPLKNILPDIELYGKAEYLNPTASFKDRPSSVGISVAKEQGATTVAVASSGNAGVSVAAYAAKEKMRCIVCIPKNTSIGKVSQLLAYGAEVNFVNGGYSDCFNLVSQLCEKFGYANLTSTYINPYTVEGDKTVAYELYEQFQEVPDWIIVPIGTGPLLAGVWRGFNELKEMGIIQKLPRMVGVQAKNCSPIAQAYKENREVHSALDWSETLAGGIADQLVGYEQDGDYTNYLINKSGGDFVILSEDEILDIWKKLPLVEGIFAEPTGACSVGAAKKLFDDGIIKKDDSVVSLITGHGLKAPDLVEKFMNDINIPTVSKIDDFNNTK
ncbi:threonine synthase [Miniphocaeibacter massiliensis]|uniref:threonine synthase n=1 Tax=Miniphocaeibacter massiliensis TaxID=2041841 RepID=UPI000C1BE2F4|nr:threonine synthase [Miniphocaeibacter massiliensis]